MIYEIKDTGRAAQLFDGWQETLIWSCLQNVMGKIYVRDELHPRCASAVLGDFCFLAGEADRELAEFGVEGRSGLIVPQNESWDRIIEAVYREKAVKVQRYAIKKEGDFFDREKLKRAANALPSGYSIQMIDEKRYEECLREKWSRDLVSLYGDYETYARLGLGVVVLFHGQIVSGASSYSRYQEGIEIEIDTRSDHRRRGLAYAGGARLILECLERGLYPSWDAQNLWSVALAEKLGYHFDHAYTTYEIELRENTKGA